MTLDFELSHTPVLGRVVDFVKGTKDVPKGGEGSLIYVEASRDNDAQSESEAEAVRDALKRVPPHEVGHQFGLRGDGLASQGIMSVQKGSSHMFVEEHLNMLRWRVNSPGQ